MMLPDCMQEPSEPCAGYTEQNARIAALETELLEHTLIWYAERMRREAAEAILRDQLDCGYFREAVHAHFAHYKTGENND